MAKDYKSVPDLLKHCTVAVYKSGKVKGGSDAERWQGAWRIARAHLTKYGYLQPGSEEGPVTEIRFTHKGAGKTRPHTQEGAAKNKLFDSKAHLLEQIDNPKKPEGLKSDSQEVQETAPAPSPIKHSPKKSSAASDFYARLKQKAVRTADGLKKLGRGPKATKVKAARVKRAKRR